MPNFSKKYNIKIANNEEIIAYLNNNCSYKKTLYSEVYFIDNNENISKYDTFSKLDNYVAIIKENNMFKLKLTVNSKEYVTSVTDLLSGVQILFAFNYSFMFVLNYELYSLIIDDILVYIIHTDNNEYIITFNKDITSDKVMYVIEKFKKDYNLKFDNNLFFDTKEDKFNKYKNSRGDI